MEASTIKYLVTTSYYKISKKIIFSQLQKNFLGPTGHQTEQSHLFYDCEYSAWCSPPADPSLHTTPWSAARRQASAARPAETPSSVQELKTSATTKNMDDEVYSIAITILLWYGGFEVLLIVSLLSPIWWLLLKLIWGSNGVEIWTLAKKGKTSQPPRPRLGGCHCRGALHRCIEWHPQWIPELRHRDHQWPAEV